MKPKYGIQLELDNTFCMRLESAPPEPEDDEPTPCETQTETLFKDSSND